MKVMPETKIIDIYGFIYQNIVTKYKIPVKQCAYVDCNSR